MGEFVAWIIGWDLILEYLFAASTVAVGWSGYVVSFLKDFGILIPAQFTAAVGTTLVNIPDAGWKPITPELVKNMADAGISLDTLPHLSGVLNLPAMFIIAATTILLLVGIRESAKFNNVMVIIKVFVILLFIGIGFMFVNKANWTPFITGGVAFSAVLQLFSLPTLDSTLYRQPHRNLKIRSAICPSAFWDRSESQPFYMF
jgi:APA family basic amino acid/polyamine antiporter